MHIDVSHKQCLLWVCTAHRLQAAAAHGPCVTYYVWAQLPAQIELNTLAEDGNKMKTTVGDVVKGKKVNFSAH